ncbi:MAG: TIGR00730 family Rossman fold protein [Candidatus Eremiobacteraeota bacterium]|nr:TIGR00730 family Rossman fold protein [Candidatus Eremiobacteraeota bacterium]
MRSSGRAERPAGPRICVFCGSSFGDDPIFRAAAAEIGRELAARGVGIVYGGGRVGCMGALADAALAAGGDVIGVIPEALATREVAHGTLGELHVVGTMHERKALMAKLSDAFLALPGGFGTLDELFEAVTWRQLGYHAKPCAVLNVDGYYDALQRFCDDAQNAGFVRPADRAALVFGMEPRALLDTLCAAIRAKRSPSP